MISFKTFPSFILFRSSYRELPADLLISVTIVASGGTLTAIPSSWSAGVIFFNSSTNFRGNLYHVTNVSGKREERSSLNCFGFPLHSCSSCISWQTGWKSIDAFNGANFLSLWISSISASIAASPISLPTACSRAFALIASST